METLNFIISIAVLLLILKGINYGSVYLAKKAGLNPRITVYAAMFLVFLICSFLWIFTPVFEVISEMTGIPLER